jgi:hypothetical protein
MFSVTSLQDSSPSLPDFKPTSQFQERHLHLTNSELSHQVDLGLASLLFHHASAEMLVWGLKQFM